MRLVLDQDLGGKCSVVDGSFSCPLPSTNDLVYGVENLPPSDSGTVDRSTQPRLGHHRGCRDAVRICVSVSTERDAEGPWSHQLAPPWAPLRVISCRYGSSVP